MGYLLAIMKNWKEMMIVIGNQEKINLALKSLNNCIIHGRMEKVGFKFFAPWADTPLLHDAHSMYQNQLGALFGYWW